MGMFDWVDFNMSCPTCGFFLDGFQTKDTECIGTIVQLKDVGYFKGDCAECGTWVYFERRPREDSTIKDFEMHVEDPDGNKVELKGGK